MYNTIPTLVKLILKQISNSVPFKHNPDIGFACLWPNLKKKWLKYESKPEFKLGNKNLQMKKVTNVNIVL